mgnify:CR=1 FL=1
MSDEHLLSELEREIARAEKGLPSQINRTSSKKAPDRFPQKRLTPCRENIRLSRCPLWCDCKAFRYARFAVWHCGRNRPVFHFPKSYRRVRLLGFSGYAVGVSPAFSGVFRSPV